MSAAALAGQLSEAQHGCCPVLAHTSKMICFSTVMLTEAKQFTTDGAAGDVHGKAF
jgi:hypothetical protein